MVDEIGNQNSISLHRAETPEHCGRLTGVISDSCPTEKTVLSAHSTNRRQRFPRLMDLETTPPLRGCMLSQCSESPRC